mgnify:CR=1 FL=1
MENHVFLPVQIAVSLCGLGSFVFQRDGFAVDCSKYKFFRCDGRRGTFSFSRKIYKLALALVLGTWSRVFQFTQFTMGCECQSKLQICSSERNIRLLPVDWRKDKFKIEAANSEDWRKDKFKIGGRKIL